MRKWFCLLAIALTSCTENPAWYPLPFQRETAVGGPATYILMNDPAADQIIVSGIRGLEGVWRWTHKRPVLKFPAVSWTKAKAVVDFSIAGETFKVTGPLTLTFLVNGRQIDRVTYSKPDNYRFEKPVTLTPGEPNTLEIQIDKVWVSPADGTQLGVILGGAGFLR